MQIPLKKDILLALILLFLTLLTRASHELTSFSLPDASLAIFIAAGIFLKQRKWLIIFVASIVTLDWYIININNMAHINFEASYLGHVFTYIMAWEVSRKFLSDRKFLEAKLFFSVSLLVIVFSYIISFSSHYFLSGWISNPNFYDGLLFLGNYFNSFFVPNTIYIFILYIIFKVLQKFPKLMIFKNAN